MEWTVENIAEGYEQMAEINLTLALEFAELEDEVENKTGTF